jgi:polyisoprenoid-binding protein YceI
MHKILLIAIATIASAAVAATDFKLDVSHSEVGFKVSHLMVSKVSGKFKEFDGSFNFDEKTKTLENLKTTIKVGSIDTSDAKRDDHLKSADFFDAGKNAEMTFKQTKKAVVKEKKATTVEGELTLKGVTKPVKLQVTYNGVVTDPWGNRKVGFEASGKVKRKDFNITWNKNLDGGGVVVGDDVEIQIAGEATAQNAAATEAKK